jgi:predicted aspartyl protease
MKLVAVGNSRKFYYLEPRLGMVAAGAMPGSLLFDGIAINNSYIGTAYIFNRRCGTVSYKVEGPILDDYRRVELTGMAPRIDTNCHVSSYFEDRLEFVLVEPTVTTANTENHFHSIKSDDGFLNLRNGPGTNHDIVVTIPSGVSDVAVSQCRPSDVLGELPWCKAEWEGHSGWLSSCCIIGDSAAAATPINNEGQGSIIPRPVESATVTEGAAMVPMLKEGGTYEVPVLINNAITLNFIVDSGSSDVSIPADVVLTLIRAGTINEGDFIGERTYRLADGSTVPARTFHIRSLKVGNRVLENVTGSVAPIAGGLLLGQSFLSRFKSWSIDNMRHALLLNE